MGADEIHFTFYILQHQETTSQSFLSSFFVVLWNSTQHKTMWWAPRGSSSSGVKANFQLKMRVEWVGDGEKMKKIVSFLFSHGASWNEKKRQQVLEFWWVLIFTRSIFDTPCWWLGWHIYIIWNHRRAEFAIRTLPLILFWIIVINFEDVGKIFKRT